MRQSLVNMHLVIDRTDSNDFFDKASQGVFIVLGFITQSISKTLKKVQGFFPAPQDLVLEVAALTHQGRVKRQNEDAYALDRSHRFFMVADGVGGAARGDLASSIVCTTALKASKSEKDLSLLIESSHEAVKQAMLRERSLEGMASTVAMISFSHGGRYDFAWVGDSRIYIHHPKQGLKLLTKDHSFVQGLVDRNMISQEEARTHPKRNVITQALGQPGAIEISTGYGVCHSNDVFLICSDGLNSMVEDEVISNILANKSMSYEDKAEALVSEALDNGGSDNITVILIGNVC